MGNVSWRSQASSEDTDSSLQGDLDEETGKDTKTVVFPLNTRKYILAWWCNGLQLSNAIWPLVESRQKSNKKNFL